MKKRLKQNKQKLFYLLIMIFILLFTGSSMSNSENIAKTRDLIQSTGIFAPFIFVILLSLTYILAPLSGTPLFFAGYILFDRNLIIYNYIAAVLSMIVNFWIARLWGRDYLVKLMGEKDIQKIDIFIHKQGIGLLIFARMFLGVLHDFISYAYGLTNIKFRDYIIISALAPIPYTAIWYYYAFDRIHSIEEFTYWFLLLFIPFTVIAFIYLKLFNKN